MLPTASTFGTEHQKYWLDTLPESNVHCKDNNSPNWLNATETGYKKQWLLGPLGQCDLLAIKFSPSLCTNTNTCI